MVVIVSARRKLFPLLLISVALCTPFSHVGSNAVDGQLDLPDFGEQEDARAEENSSDKVPAQCDAEPGKDCTRTPVHYQESPPAQDSPLSGNHHAGAEEESNLNPSSVDDAQSLEAFQQAFLTAASIEKDDAELWDAPIQLVRPNPKGHEELEIVEEGLKRLAQVPSPLALIAVVGKFHTGKSFLLNQVMRKQRGFGVGSTVRPETMGIWMWGKPMTMTLESGVNISVVFIDTEGFAASNISESYDAKVFAVASLLSSYLIYNSVKIIDQSDIDYLELLSRRTQLFALQSQLNAEKYALEFNHNLLKFPSLLWVVQDFVQAGLSGNEGQSAQDWLKQLMRTSTREQEHEISLLDIFESVDCHTLFLPAIRKVLLEDLSQAHEEDLTEEYRAERDDLIEKLRRGLVAKERNGVPVDGAELALLIKLLVTAANQGSLAEIPGRWGAFTQHLLQTAYHECLNFFDAESDKLLHGGQRKKAPSSSTALGNAALHTWFSATANKTLQVMERLLIGLGSSLKQSTVRVQKALSRRYDTIIELNARRVDILCQQTQRNIEVQVEHEASKLSLPQPLKHLKDHLWSIVVERGFNPFAKTLAHINDTDSYRTYNSSLEDILSRTVDKFTSKNREAFVDMLNKIDQDAVALYHTGIKPELVRPLTTKQLQVLQRDESDKATQHWVEESVAAKDEPDYERFKSSFMHSLMAAQKETGAANEKRVRALCDSTVSSVLDMLHERFNSKVIALPTNESHIQSRFLEVEEIIITQFVAHMEKYADMDAYTGCAKDLNDKSHAARDLLLKENLDAYMSEVEVPLATAVKIAMMSADTYDTAFSLHQYVNTVCVLHLDSGKAQDWSEHLKQQIVDNYISSHAALQAEFRSRSNWWYSMKGFVQWIVWYVTNIFG
ncbi:guanylate-binding protein 2-like [Sycon ciliatum]|uniref:guanylate-binding protein 2-like n=1 Tax=Sycon ciliatum TaxID=27933 RepID=UPI0031F689B6